MAGRCGRVGGSAGQGEPVGGTAMCVSVGYNSTPIWASGKEGGRNRHVLWNRVGQAWQCVVWSGRACVAVQRGKTAVQVRLWRGRV